MNKRKSLLVSLMIISIVWVNITIVFAATKSELNGEKNDINKKIENTEKIIEDLHDDITETMKEIRSLTAQITSYEQQIDDLNEEISDLEKQITKTQKKLEEAQAKYDKQEEMLQNRLVALYEAGETTYLDVLLSSDGLTDFISNYYLVSEVATYDTELLDQMEKNRNEIKEVKKKLQSSKKKVESTKKSKEKTSNALKNSKSVKADYASELTSKEKKKQAELDAFEADKRAIEKQLAEIARREAQKNGGQSYIPAEPNKNGYIFPVAGLDIYSINNRNYPSYPGHTGVDVNLNVTGRSVVAVKSGTVVISTALKNSNGTYRSYGEYIVIDHHDGTMTLYAHGYPGSRRVSEGQSVKQGQVIMTVGTTGNSTGNHLHFEVRVNGRCVNPLPYLY